MAPLTLLRLSFLFALSLLVSASPSPQRQPKVTGRERLSINHGWHFQRFVDNPDGLIYDTRPDSSAPTILKPWILPSANDFIADPANRHPAPSKPPNINVTFAQKSFDDRAWQTVDVPHDWAIKGPFYVGTDVPVKGGMGRLPIQGIGWYRRAIQLSPEDKDKTIYLEVEGAMSYATVWINGRLVGGWPFGYSSFGVDLTPYLDFAEENVLAIRLDNPIESSRWYPGAGIYRNVWLSKVEKVRVAQWGTFVTTSDVSASNARVDLQVRVENGSQKARNGTRIKDAEVTIKTEVHILDPATGQPGKKVASFPNASVQVSAGETRQVNASLLLSNPRLWGPPPSQEPNLYVAITRLSAGHTVLDTYATQFGIRSVTYDSNKGLLVNDEHVRIQGVNQHHDLGALGAAFNLRAATRQLELLQEVGCNAIRMSHNPPAPELLSLTDQMGFLVIDEVFDMWQRNKTNSDAHLFFDDWAEPILRSFIRRDRNHPSVIIWSVGNEVGEQYTDNAGAAIGQRLVSIAHDEDPTRPVTASMNYAKPDMPFPEPFDVLSLNYQGEGIRDAPAYAHLAGIKTSPLYNAFHSAFPGKMILSSESAAALSSRGVYYFPVTSEISAPVNDTNGGGNSSLHHVSSYDLYTADFGSSADKVFAAQDAAPFVAGEFVWSGWDYLGEPTPYYTSRSSYFGMIDLAGFPKDRFYLYQARWRRDKKVAHLLPHWTWLGREGRVTPVHVFSNAEEAELFVNGKSMGRRRRVGDSTYRFRWDDVVYQPGNVKVVTYDEHGDIWATDAVQTAGTAARLVLSADRIQIALDGEDLAFITLKVEDSKGVLVPEADTLVRFEIEGPAEIVAIDNGDPTDFTSFPARERNAFNGLALAIVRGKRGEKGTVTVTATAKGMKAADVKVRIG